MKLTCLSAVLLIQLVKSPNATHTGIHQTLFVVNPSSLLSTHPFTIWDEIPFPR